MDKIRTVARLLSSNRSQQSHSVLFCDGTWPAAFGASAAARRPCKGGESLGRTASNADIVGPTPGLLRDGTGHSPDASYSR